MFIKDKDTFLLLENIKQAKKFLTDKVGIELSEDEYKYTLFKNIVNKLKKTPNLVYIFTKLLFVDGASADAYEETLRVIDWVNNNKNIAKQLPKNIIEYVSLEELADAIIEVESKVKVKKFYSSLYSEMKNEIDNLDEEKKSRFDSLAESFMNLKEEYKKLFIPLKYFKMNDVSIIEFLDTLENFVNKSDKNEDKDRVLNYVKDNNLKVMYNDHNVIVINTKDKEAVCELGSEKWCIVYSDYHYDNYIGKSKYSTQFTIYNFNLQPSNPNSMFGITIKPNNKVYSTATSQNKKNTYVPLEEIYDMTGIPEGTLKSDYHDLYLKTQKELDKYIEDLDITGILNSVLDKNLFDFTYRKVLYRWIEKEKDVSNFLDSLFKIEKENKEDLHTFLTNVHNEVGRSNPLSIILADILSTSLDTILDKLGEYFNQFDIDTIHKMVSMLDNSIGITHFKRSDRYLKMIFSKFKDIDELIEFFMYNEVTKVFYGGLSIHNIIKLISFYIPFKSYIVLYYLSNNINRRKDDIISKIYNLDEIEEGISSFKPYIANLIVGDKDKWDSSVLHIMDGVISKYVDKYLFSENLLGMGNGVEYDTFKDYIIVYNKLKKVYDEEEDDYSTLLANIGTVMKEFSILPDEQLDSEENRYSLYYYVKKAMDAKEDIYDDADVIESDSFFNLLGRVGNKYDIDTKDNLLLYAMSEVNSKYTTKFYQGIGLEFDEDSKVWYMETTYGDLAEYYDRDVELEDYYDMFYHYVDSIYYEEYFYDINIDNLKILANYFADNGFNLDTTSLDKYKDNVSYGKSQEYYGEDKELKQLLSDVEDIVKENYEIEEDGDNPYDDIDISDIQSSFDNAMGSADSDARGRQWWGNTISNLDKLFDYWPEGAKAFGKNLLKGGNKGDSNLLVIPNISNLLAIDMLPIIGTFVDLSSMDIENIIDAYLGEEGKIEVEDTDGYMSLDDGDYDYFNERFGEELYDLIPTKTDESFIVKYSDFLVEDKNIEEIPTHFIKEFNNEDILKEDLEYYNKVIKELNIYGGTVYTLTFLEDISDLDVVKLGEQWTIEKDQLSNFYDSLKGDNQGNPYLIIGQLKSDQIDEEKSYRLFGKLSHELGVILKSNPIRYEFIPYRGTPDADIIWTNNLV